MANHPVEERPHCQECCRKRRKEIAEAYNKVSTHTIKRVEKVGLHESEVVGIQGQMQRKLQVALYELDGQCLDNSM